MNMRCSNRWANPLRPAGSSFDPTRYHTFTVATGSAWSSWRITVRPFASLYFSSFIFSSDLATDDATRAAATVARNQDLLKGRLPRSGDSPDPRAERKG